MTIETLVVAVDQNDHSLAEKMNLQTDAIIGNQCQRVSTEKFVLGDREITYLNTNGRGVGENRNIVLARASADVCVFADDDMTFVDGYPMIVERAFKECPTADVLIFNLIEKQPRRYATRAIKRIRCYNYGKFGAARFVVRRKSVVNAGIRFSTAFGGGTQHGSGEDSIFLKECLDRGLKLYAVPYAIAEIDQSAASSWFDGYNEKYFYDKGALYARLYPLSWRVMALRFLLLHGRTYREGLGFDMAFRRMMNGGEGFLAEREK